MTDLVSQVLLTAIVVALVVSGGSYIAMCRALLNLAHRAIHKEERPTRWFTVFDDWFAPVALGLCGLILIWSPA